VFVWFEVRPDDRIAGHQALLEGRHRPRVRLDALPADLLRRILAPGVGTWRSKGCERSDRST
jgi:hypothetical protein